MDEHTPIQSQVHYDLAMHKEFSRINADAYGRNTFFLALTVLCLLYLISGFDNSYTVRIFLLFSVVFSVIRLITWFKSKDGGLQYKQTLHNNGGLPPRHLVTLEADGLRQRNLDTGNERLEAYCSIHFLMESKNLLICVTELKLCFLIDKRTLSGCTRDELVTLLLEKCPNLKKRIRKGTLGRLVRYLVPALILIGVIAGLATILHIPEKLSGQTSNDITYQEIAEELAELDIHISPATLDALAEYEGQTGTYYNGYPKALELLSWEGMGIYEKNVFFQVAGVEAYDWEWTPSESGVYWFDLEFMDCTSIYTDFLRGVDAMDDDLAFSNVTEDYSGVDMANGTGTVTVSFDYLDQHYTFSARYESDWFDTDMLAHIGLILNSDEAAEDLWYTFDGQGVLLYYGTEEEALALEKKTGLFLLDPVSQTLYSY